MKEVVVSVSVDVSGLLKLSRDLNDLDRVVTAAVQKAVDAGADLVEATAKQLVPVRTGDLRDSIGIDRSELHAEIGPSLARGAYVEFGTSTMPPEPFMQPAMERHERRIRQSLIDAAQQAVRSRLG